MDEMFHSLKKGGVSLIGQNQPTTHDQLRKSFIKRNKNPVINEKIHTLRALQSTLKVRHAFTPHTHTHTLLTPHYLLLGLFKHTVVLTFVIGCLCFLGEGGGASSDKQDPRGF